MMNNEAEIDITWEILDQDSVQALLARKGATALIDELDSSTPTPQNRANILVELAINGRINPLKQETTQLCDWAAQYGVRRIENALIELDRVLASSKRGKALLNAQALTRFIARNIDADILALKTAIKGNG